MTVCLSADRDAEIYRASGIKHLFFFSSALFLSSSWRRSIVSVELNAAPQAVQRRRRFRTVPFIHVETTFADPVQYGHFVKLPDFT
ncbi:MAG: hypothetical protein Q4C96_04125, partial [Planctomycetia bacterium]|nr:hypothetical protein [Planctomycetia bacterium]